MTHSQPIDASRAALFAFLDTHNIEHTTHEHKAVFTVEESADIKGQLPGGHTKNLFLKDKAGAYFLICALGDTQIKINHLHRHLESKRLSFGKPDALLDKLGVLPGSVTLFSILHDKAQSVQLVLDKALLSHDIVNFHPLTNTATTAISNTDMIKFAEQSEHTPIIIDFAELAKPLE